MEFNSQGCDVMSQQIRASSRRESERRQIEKRKIHHAFGSQEWTKELMKNYVMWPKNEQRDHDRREEERRQAERRIISESASTFRVLAKKGAELLSAEEMQLLKELPLRVKIGNPIFSASLAVVPAL